MKKQINRLARFGLGIALAVVPALAGSQMARAQNDIPMTPLHIQCTQEAINNHTCNPNTGGQQTQPTQPPQQTQASPQNGQAQCPPGSNLFDLETGQTGCVAASDLTNQANASNQINQANQNASLTMAEKENQSAQQQMSEWGSSNRNLGINQKLDASLLEDKSNGDSCGTSEALGMGMGCAKTERQIKTFQTLNQVGQAVGATAVGITGQISNQNAAQSGSQVEMIKAQGKIQEMGAGLQVTNGLMNTAFGVIQMQTAGKHDENAKALNAAKSHATDLQIRTDGDASAQFKYRESGYYNNVDYESQAGSLKATGDNDIVKKIAQEGILSGGKAATANNGGIEALGKGLSTSITAVEADALSRHFPNGNPQPQAVDAKGKAFDQQVTAQYQVACPPVLSPRPPTCATRGTWLASLPKTDPNRVMYDDSISLQRAAMVVGARNNSISARQLSLQKQVSSTAQAASAEQTNEAANARQGGIISLIQGVAQMAQGALSYEAAKVAENAALNYNTGNTQPAFQVTSGVAQTLSPTNPGTTALQPGTGGDTPPPTNPGNITANSIPNLGTPVNPDATGGGAGGGPAPNSFAGGVPAPAAGSGGGAGITVGATQPDRSSGEVDNSPRAAPAGPPANYNSSGQGYVAGGGGVGAEKGQDLSFLANLLPKKEDEPSKNGILDFGKNRSPASMAPYSLLGRDVNLFKRISDTMSEKAKSGSVGI